MKKIRKLLTVILAGLLLFGCTQKPGPTDKLNEMLETLRETSLYDLTEGFLGGEAKNDVEKAVYIQMEKMLKDHEFTLSNEQVNGNKATVDMHIRTYDLAQAYRDMLQMYLGCLFEILDGEEEYTDEELDELIMYCWLETLLNTEKAGLSKETDMTFEMEKIDGEWMIMSNNYDEFIDVYLGGMMSTIGNIGNE